VRDPAPLASDVAFVLAHLQPMLIARGLPLDRLGTLAFGIAMDARIRVRLETASPEQRAALEDARHAMQQTTRAILSNLNRLPIHRVETVPRDESGQDRELAELFPVPTEALLAVSRTYLTEMDQEDDAG
jgi:hypothetical protein